MIRRFSRILIISGGLMAVVAMGYSLFWYSVMSRVQDGIKRWTIEQRVHGWDVSLGKQTISGFPFLITVSFDEPKLTGRNNKLRWALPNVKASTRPWALGRVAITGPGVHVINLPDGKRSLQLNQAKLNVDFASGQFQKAALYLGGIKLAFPDENELNAEFIKARVRSNVFKEENDNALGRGVSVQTEVRQVVLPKAWRSPLGNKIPKISLDVMTIDDIPFRGGWTAALESWRDNGGTLEIKTFDIDWKPLSLRAEGTFSFDEMLQPQGAMTAQIDGIDPATEALIAAGVIDARTAFAVKFANRALTSGGRSVRLPLRVQKSRLYLGPVQVLKFRPLHWK